MTPALRNHLLSNLAGWTAAASCAFGALAIGFLFLRLPGLPNAERSRVDAAAWPPVESLAGLDWSVFSGFGGAAPGGTDSDFRLAGTFFQYGRSGEDARRAILDHVSAGRQVLVSEGDRIGNTEVVRIFHNRVVLRENSRERELWLSFSRAATTPHDDGQGQKDGAEAGAAIETSRFGKRAAERRWVFRRDALLEYYNELLEDPMRLSTVFASLKPVYEQNKIGGYYLDVEGEEDFFNSVGLRQGDIVRKVNSMNMTSQRRAEYFIREFVDSRINAFVLDVERGNKPEKLVYLVR